MNVNKLLVQLLLMVLFTMGVFGQNTKKETPYSFKNKLPKRNIQNVIMPELDTIKISKEDILERGKQIPPRFGYTHNVNYNLNNSGTWTKLPDGSRLWEFSINCKGARSINLLYDKFWLPNEAKLFIYNESKKQIIGAFTSKNNEGTVDNPSAFATGLVYGSKIFLEYYEPKGANEESIISIAGIVHGYRYINLEDNKSDKDFGDSGDCNVNVNCPQGANWQTEKRGVALIVVNGDRYCTGCLINNSQNNGLPYLLTANHCLSGWANPVPLDAVNNPNANTWTFLWNYESPNCTDQDITNPNTTARATVIANNAETDFALLQLTESPDNFDVYYCGWDRTGLTPNSSIGIHHPSGDIKKISFDDDAPDISGYDNQVCTMPNGTTHWEVIWDLGVTEGGSSGSPLFDPNHRIIGQLQGGFALCFNDDTNCDLGPNEPDYYGRLSESWNSSANSTSRLRDWLNPSNDINILSGLRLIEGRTINSNTPASGDIVRLDNVNIESSSNINININERLEINGTFSAPVGSTLVITP